jgi:N-acetylglucosamine kinase-like BadF-type ATPase
MADILVLGLDIGGAATRAVVATADGTVVSRGYAGDDRDAREPGATADEVLTALRQALAAVDPASVQAAMLGLAGLDAATGGARIRAALDSAWERAGLTCPYTQVDEALVAFAAGTPAPDGTVLVAGAGAMAASVRGRRLRRLADGHGWLLGDVGGGYWLGREAVRAALAELDQARSLSELSRQVLAGILGSDDTVDARRATVNAVVAAVHTAPPVALARLAPLVMTAHAIGDPDATRLVQAAADRLVETVFVVRGHGEHTPFVLAGDLLTADTPLASAVRVRVSVTWPEADAATAGDTAAAAAWLAGLAADPVDEDGARRRHARLVI